MARTLISSGSAFEKLAGYSRAVADGEWEAARPRVETPAARQRANVNVHMLANKTRCRP